MASNAGHRLEPRQGQWRGSLGCWVCSVPGWAALARCCCHPLCPKEQLVPSPSGRTFACSCPQVGDSDSLVGEGDARGHLAGLGGLRNSLVTAGRSPCTLNAAWLRQGGRNSGFPALPLLSVLAKIKSFDVCLLLHLLGALQKDRRHRQTFQGSQGAAHSAAPANDLIKLTGPSRSTEKSQEPSKTVGAPWLVQQT